MIKQTNIEKLQEQYCIGTSLGILAQYIADSKLGFNISHAGSKMANEARSKLFTIEPDDERCPKIPEQIFLDWLQKHKPTPPVPPIEFRVSNNEGIIYASTKPLPPREEDKISSLATLNYLNELFNVSKSKDLQTQLTEIAGMTIDFFEDGIPVCGTVIPVPKLT